MALLYKSTASQVVMLKLFLSSDHVTAATGKTLAITISKNGGAFGNPNAGATNATEVSSGWYKVTLDATDTGTEGDLVVRGTAASCDDSERVFRVHLPVNFATTSIDANGRVDVIKIAGTTQTARDIGASVLLAAAQKVDVDTIKTNPVVNAGTITFPTDATVASTTNITAGTVTTATNVTTVSNGGIAAASFAAGAIDAAAIAANAIGASELASDVITDIWQGTALTESYAADGVAPTPAQFMYQIWSALSDFVITSTTIHTKKLDGTTDSMTFTLDDATNPTSRTRAT
jgi:hypothetical protein